MAKNLDIPGVPSSINVYNHFPNNNPDVHAFKAGDMSCLNFIARHKSAIDVRFTFADIPSNSIIRFGIDSKNFAQAVILASYDPGTDKMTTSVINVDSVVETTRKIEELAEEHSKADASRPLRRAVFIYSQDHRYSEAEKEALEQALNHFTPLYNIKDVPTTLRGGDNTYLTVQPLPQGGIASFVNGGDGQQLKFGAIYTPERKK